MTQDVMEWLRQVRKLDAELLGAMGVKPTPDGSAVAFPYRRAGRPYAWKFRTLDKRMWSTKDVSRGLFNEDDLSRLPELPIVITEGEIDCLSVMQAGFERAVSVPNGWKAEATECEPLVQAEADLRRSPYVIVAGDNDEAGESLPRFVANLLKGHDVRAVRWPEGCKDANDVLMLHGEGALSACLMAAKRLDPPGGLITGFSDLPPLGNRRVMRIGEKPFDWAVAFETGTMSVWTGIPGSGKSTFLRWAADRVSINENIRVGLMAFEDHPHTIRDQLFLIRTGKDFANQQESTRVALVAEFDRRYRLVHHMPEPEGDDRQHLAWLERMVWTLAARDGCKLIIIDPWNELEHLPEPGETMTTYINFATKTIRQWAEKLDVHIALVAHPKKMPTEFKPRPPTGYDIADSAAFFNKPSLGVTVHQREAENADGTTDEWVELHVWKVRNTRLYRFEKGKIACRFDKATMRYVEREAHPTEGGRA
jgi:twinkle protein